MALNTIHKNNKDLVPVYNKTQDKYFNCEILGEAASERVKTSLGLDLPSTKLTLKVNGFCDVAEKDKIKVLNDIFIVSKLSNSYSITQQFRKRADYELFNGTTFIFLE